MRKWRRKLNSFSTKNPEQWQFEIGEQLAPRNLESAGLMESLSNVSYEICVYNSITGKYELHVL